jgi:hypothetical protein
LEDVSGRDSCDYAQIMGMKELKEIYGCQKNEFREAYNLKEDYIHDDFIKVTND